MTNDLTTFTFAPSNTTVRVVTIDGEPWFVAMDLYEPLGLYPALLRARLKNMAQSEWALVNGAQYNLTSLTGGQLRRYLISESGLYKLVMRSDKPQARKFQDWVTRDVLPAIRKDGMYVMGEEKVATGESSVDELEAQLMQAA